MIVLLILDGFGMRNEKKGNAVKLARMPFYNSLLKKYPHSALKAGGESDGLQKGTIGNSEVGHLNIGAGRIVLQDDTRITNSIKDRSFFKNKLFAKAMHAAKAKKSEIHILGLVSDEGVHSRIAPLFALLKMAKENRLKANVHALTDGRDCAPKSGLKHIEKIEGFMSKNKIGKICTVGGRYYAMDRDKRWDRTKKGYDAIVFGKGLRKETAKKAILDSYKKGITDEFIQPSVIGDYKGINKDDIIITFNFRPDRMRQICSLFEKNKIKLFTMAQYDKKLKSPYAFSQLKIKNFLGEVLAKNKKRQLRIAETEKYAHATYFLNGQVEKPMKYEDRILIKSNRKVATYDLAPEMRAKKITEKILNGMKNKKYDVIIANIANPDMLGHTGNIKAAIKGLEIVDGCIMRIIENRNSNIVIIISDHGNCEEMEGKNSTSHTLNPVPFLIINDKKPKTRNGIHADIAPTILDLMKIKKPKEMTGNSLLLTG